MRSVLPVAVGLEPALSVSLHKYDGVCGERKYLILPFINTVGLRMGLARGGREEKKIRRASIWVPSRSQQKLPY